MSAALMEADALREYLRIACNALGYDHAEAWEAPPSLVGGRSRSSSGTRAHLESGQQERIASRRLPLPPPCLAVTRLGHSCQREPSERPMKPYFAPSDGHDQYPLYCLS